MSQEIVFKDSRYDPERNGNREFVVVKPLKAGEILQPHMLLATRSNVKNVAWACRPADQWTDEVNVYFAPDGYGGFEPIKDSDLQLSYPNELAAKFPVG